MFSKVSRLNLLWWNFKSVEPFQNSRAATDDLTRDITVLSRDCQFAVKIMRSDDLKISPIYYRPDGHNKKHVNNDSYISTLIKERLIPLWKKMYFTTATYISFRRSFCIKWSQKPLERYYPWMSDDFCHYKRWISISSLSQRKWLTKARQNKTKE